MPPTPEDGASRRRAPSSVPRSPGARAILMSTASPSRANGSGRSARDDRRSGGQRMVTIVQRFISARSRAVRDVREAIHRATPAPVASIPMPIRRLVPAPPPPVRLLAPGDIMRVMGEPRRRALGDIIRVIGEPFRALGDIIRPIGEAFRALGDIIRAIGEPVRVLLMETPVLLEAAPALLEVAPILFGMAPRDSPCCRSVKYVVMRSTSGSAMPRMPVCDPGRPSRDVRPEDVRSAALRRPCIRCCMRSNRSCASWTGPAPRFVGSAWMRADRSAVATPGPTGSRPTGSRLTGATCPTPADLGVTRHTAPTRNLYRHCGKP